MSTARCLDLIVVSTIAALVGAASVGCGDGSPDAMAQSDAGLEPDPADAAPPGPPPLCAIGIACGQAVPDEPKIACAISIDDGLGEQVHRGLIGIERRGRSSIWFAKPQYAIELRDPLGLEEPIDLFDMGRAADWILNGMYIDRGLLRNKLVYDMFQSLGGAERYAPESVYCSLEIDGDPVGVYALGERVERDDDRVVLADDGGVGASFILKQDDDVGFRAVGSANGNWQLVYPRFDRATEAQQSGVAAWLARWDAAVAGAPTADDLFDLIDLESAVDFVLFEEFVKNVDAYYLSMHVAKDPDGRLRWIPWDVDLSFGQPLYGDATMTAGWITYRPPMIQAMADDPRFAARLVDRWGELRAGLITSAGIQARIDAQMTTIADAIEANFARWPIEEIQFLDNQLPPRASHAEELAVIAAWIDGRIAWMDANVAAYAAGNP